MIIKMFICQLLYEVFNMMATINGLFPLGSGIEWS